MAGKTHICAALVISIGLLGCRSSGSEIDQAIGLAETHLGKFAEFYQWARGVCAAEPSLLDQKPETLREAAFAPIRKDPSVLGAWIELRGARSYQRALSLPGQSELPAPLAWVPLKDHELGKVKVASAAPCPLKTRLKPQQADVRACVFISREAPLLDRTLAVTVAFGQR